MPFGVCDVTCANVVGKARFKAGPITKSAVELTRFDGQTILPVQADLSVSAKPQSAERLRLIFWLGWSLLVFASALSKLSSRPENS